MDVPSVLSITARLYFLPYYTCLICLLLTKQAACFLIGEEAKVVLTNGARPYDDQKMCQINTVAAPGLTVQPLTPLSAGLLFGCAISDPDFNSRKR